MPARDVVEALGLRFGAEPFDLGAVVAAGRLLEAARALRDQHGYRFYVCGVGVERADGFDVLHGLRRLDPLDEIFLKVRLSKQAPSVDSLAFVFAGAEWHEREMLDLLGIEFASHPDPRRILMPDDYEGHPLRKDFPIDAPWGFRPATREPG